MCQGGWSRTVTFGGMDIVCYSFGLLVPLPLFEFYRIACG